VSSKKNFKCYSNSTRVCKETPVSSTIESKIILKINKCIRVIDHSKLKYGKYNQVRVFIKEQQ
jgi:hypothetical protein